MQCPLVVFASLRASNLIPLQAGPVPAEVVKSLKILYDEGADLHSGKPKAKFAVSELRGDWKFQQEPGATSEHLFIHIYIYIILCLYNGYSSYSLCIYDMHGTG